MIRVGVNLLIWLALQGVVVATCQAGQASGWTTELVSLPAAGVAEQSLRVRVLLPPCYALVTTRYRVLYMNDGQDIKAIGMETTLQRLYADHEITPLIVVAIEMPPDRMGGYGLFDRMARQAIPAQSKYGLVGQQAQAYAQWMTTKLVPFIDARYHTDASPNGRSLLGWSLGALSAFGIGWQYPELFGRVGVFSPSFWISEDRSDADSIQATRLVHRLVDKSTPMLRPRMFFAVGTAEETDDRDGDGVIDVIDDTRDLMEGWQAPDGSVRKGLRQLGLGVSVGQTAQPDYVDASLFILEGGHHNQESWARMLPEFLRWAFASPASLHNPGPVNETVQHPCGEVQALKAESAAGMK